MRLREFACSSAALCLLALAAGCTDNAASEESFLEGRDMVTIYEQALPDDFDPDAFVANLGKVFGISDDAFLDFYEGDDDLSVDLGSGAETGTASVNLQTLAWGFTSPTYYLDSDCEQCEPSSVNEADAIERAKELFAATGSLIGDFDFAATRDIVRVGRFDVEFTTVRAARLLEGEPTGEQWLMDFGNGDEVLRARGFASQPISLGDVGLLTPAEALAQESNQLATDIPIDTTTGAVLAYDTSFNRQTLRSFLVPVYRFPLNTNLDLATSILAIRRNDLPQP